MTLAKPINKYIDYIDAPEDTFEQYVEKALKYNFRCVFANLQELPAIAGRSWPRTL